MLPRLSLAGAVVLAFGVLSTTAGVSTPSSLSRRNPNYDSDSIPALQPIHIDDYHNALGIVRRDGPLDQKSRMKARDQARLIYGLQHDQNEATIADLAVDFGSKRVIVLEEIRDIVVDFYCKENKLNLTFDSEEHIREALHDWIQAMTDGDLYIIISSGNCAGDDQRHIYSVWSIKHAYNNGSPEYGVNMIMGLREESWDNVLENFSLDIKKRSLSDPRQLRRRQDAPEDDDKNGFEEFVEEVKPDFEGGKIMRLPLRIGEAQNSTINMYPGIIPEELIPAGIKVDCIDCFVHGNITAEVGIIVKNAKIENFTISASTSGIRTRVQTHVQLTKEFASQNSRLPEVTLFSTDDHFRALFGISIPKIFRFGPALEVKVGMEVSLPGEFNFTTSVTSDIPPESNFLMDLNAFDDTNESSADLRDIDTTASFEIDAFQASLKAGIFAETSLTFGVNILDEKIKLDAGLNFKVPALSADFSIGYKRDGFCDDDESGSKTGVQVQPALGAELSFSVERTFGNKAGQPNPLYEVTLWELEKELPGKCIPVALQPEVTEKLRVEEEERLIADARARGEDIGDVLSPKPKEGSISGAASSPVGSLSMTALSLIVGVSSVFFVFF